MESVPVNLYYWKPTDEDKRLGLKILTAIEQMVQKAEADASLQPLECLVNSEEARAPVEFNLVFGPLAMGQLAMVNGAEYVNLGNIKDLHPNSESGKARLDAFELMQDIAKKIIQFCRIHKEYQKAYVETPEGVTVGKTDTDIVVTEAEAEYLRQLKELLGGSKIVITKGETKIEVE